MQLLLLLRGLSGQSTTHRSTIDDWWVFLGNANAVSSEKRRDSKVGFTMTQIRHFKARGRGPVRRDAGRLGVTLIELIVTLGIIGLLIGLLLPAVQKARGSANRLRSRANSVKSAWDCTFTMTPLERFPPARPPLPHRSRGSTRSRQYPGTFIYCHSSSSNSFGNKQWRPIAQTLSYLLSLHMLVM